MPTGSTAYANWVDSVCKRVEKICQLYVYVCVHTHKKQAQSVAGGFPEKGGVFSRGYLRASGLKKYAKSEKTSCFLFPSSLFIGSRSFFGFLGVFSFTVLCGFGAFFVNIRVKKVCQSIKKHNFFHKKRTGETRHFTQNARVCLLPFYRLSVLYQRAAKPQRSENEAREKSQQNLTLSLAFTSIDIYR